MVILSVDYGERHVGIAVTDPDGRTALRHAVVDQHDTPAQEAVVQAVAESGAGKVLVGVPMSLDGTESDQTHASLAFIEALRGALDLVEVEGVDEMFTSKEARRRLQAEGGKPEDEHAEAARLMLEHYLRSEGGVAP